MTRFRAAAVALCCLAAALVPAHDASASAPRKFSNCTQLNKVYPHGVGRAGARDHTSGKPVTTFKRDTRTYNVNTARDRDKDGIACEKR